jgi:hypothetical protein
MSMKAFPELIACFGLRSHKLSRAPTPGPVSTGIPLIQNRQAPCKPGANPERPYFAMQVKIPFFATRFYYFFLYEAHKDQGTAF